MCPWEGNLCGLLTSNQTELPAGSIMIFIKHFDIANQKLTGVGKVYVPRANKVSDLIPIINERMRWTPGTPLKLYEVCLPRSERYPLFKVASHRKSNLG